MMNNSWRDVDGHSDTQGPSGGKKKKIQVLCVFCSFATPVFACCPIVACALPAARCQINDADARAPDTEPLWRYNPIYNLVDSCHGSLAAAVCRLPPSSLFTPHPLQTQSVTLGVFVCLETEQGDCWLHICATYFMQNSAK